MKKDVLKTFAVFTGKLQTWNFIKKDPNIPLNIATNAITATK